MLVYPRCALDQPRGGPPVRYIERSAHVGAAAGSPTPFCIIRRDACTRPLRAERVTDPPGWWRLTRIFHYWITPMLSHTCYSCFPDQCHINCPIKNYSVLFNIWTSYSINVKFFLSVYKILSQFMWRAQALRTSRTVSIVKLSAEWRRQSAAWHDKA